VSNPSPILLFLMSGVIMANLFLAGRKPQIRGEFYIVAALMLFAALMVASGQW
jgi:hypothetical protein